MIEKHCPACYEYTNVNPDLSEGICDFCGKTFQIVKNKSCYRGIQLVYISPNKKCPVCGEIKLIDEFYNNCNTSDRHSSFCKSCTNEKHKVHARKRKDTKGIPDLSQKKTLSAILPHLISVSKNGYYADKILNESIARIKAELYEA